LLVKEKPAVPKPGDVEPQKGGFPVPPMDLVVPPSPRTKRVIAERETVPAGAGETDAEDSGSEV
jgi:NADH-quinone oxidoreductase subunit H